MRDRCNVPVVLLVVSFLFFPTSSALAQAEAASEEGDTIAAERERVPAIKAVPEENLEIADDMQPCAEKLKKIYAAIEKYRKDKGKRPDWLSDLVPDYLDKGDLLSPNHQTAEASTSLDPKLPCHFSYQFAKTAPSTWGPIGGMSYQDWKPLQVEFFGDLVPLVRCGHGSMSLNVSFGGQVYWSSPGWEWLFMPGFRRGDELPADQRPFDYAIPSDADALLKFITALKEHRPTTPYQVTIHAQRAPTALRTAATKIVQLEKDQWSEAYQTALRVLLEDRIRTTARGNSALQQQTIALVKDFLTVRIDEDKLVDKDVDIAVSAAEAMESAGNGPLAAEAYGQFAELISKSKNKALLEVAESMKGAVERLELIASAAAHLANGEYEKAAADYTTVIEHHSQDPVIYQRRAQAHNAAGAWDEAIADYTELIKQQPESAGTFIARGKAHVRKSDLEAARADFDEAIRLQPSNSAAYCNRAQCRLQAGDFDGAAADYNQAVEIARQNDSSFVNVDAQQLRKARQDPLIAGDSPLALKSARVWTTEESRKLDWHEMARLTWPDYVVFGGYQPVDSNHPFVIFALAQIRGELSPGFIMHAMTVNATHAEWDVSLPKGSRLALRWGLTEMAVRISGNGAKFTCIAVDDEGTEHVVAEQICQRRDSTVYEQDHEFDYAVKKLRFVHDNLGHGYGDDLWIQPSIQIPD